MAMTAEDRIRASVDRWLRAATEDADRRGLPELRPLLDALAQAAITLRAADWNDAVPQDIGAEGGKAEGGKAGGA
jgi:hypothetical protein